jgi:hypothetical protein
MIYEAGLLFEHELCLPLGSNRSRCAWQTLGVSLPDPPSMWQTSWCLPRENCPGGGLGVGGEAGRLEGGIKPQPQLQPPQGKGNSEQSMMLPFGFGSPGTWVWVLEVGGWLQVETVNTIFTKIFEDNEDSHDDQNTQKSNLFLCLLCWQKQPLLCLLRLLWSDLKTD